MRKKEQNIEKKELIITKMFSFSFLHQIQQKSQVLQKKRYNQILRKEKKSSHTVFVSSIIIHAK